MALEKRKCVAMVGKGRDEIRSEIGKVTGMVPDASITDNLEKKGM